MVVTHNRVTGLLAAKWLSKTKKRVQTKFRNPGMYLLNSKGNFGACSSKLGNGYSNRGVNKRVGGRSETQKNESKY